MGGSGPVPTVSKSNDGGVFLSCHVFRFQHRTTTASVRSIVSPVILRTGSGGVGSGDGGWTRGLDEQSAIRNNDTPV